jgi:hypothetical protein
VIAVMIRPIRCKVAFAGTFSVVLALVACASSQAVPEGAGSQYQYEAKDMKGLQERLERFAPYALRYDDSRLSADQRELLRDLVEAGNLVDRIFLEQMHPANARIFEDLKARYRAEPTPENRALLEYFWINKSPYDQLDDEAPNSLFLDGPGLSTDMDPGRSFYPEGWTPEVFRRWLESLTSDEARRAATSDFTVIREERTDAGETAFRAVPYSEAYAEWLGPLASVLEQAAGPIDGSGSTLAKFLRSRARAFRTNDYEESEGIWIGMNGLDDEGRGPIDVTIGPYENYMDELAKKKAAFQFYMGVLRPDKTEALQLFRDQVHSMDEHLWELFRKYYGDETAVRWSPPGAGVTLVAMDVVYATGMGNQGVQTLAYNLPNVEAWQEKFGSKKVMLMNVLDGKFEKILEPIARVVLREADLANVVSGMFTDNTVRHEVAHGIGPSTIFVRENGDGEEAPVHKTTVRDRLGRYYSAFEEAKAEIVSLLFGYRLVETGAIRDPDYTRRMVTTYVASGFRTIRFGVTSDHARGKIFEFNRLVDYGGIRFRDGFYSIDHERMRGAVEKLAMDILALQMLGDAKTAAHLLRTDGHPRVELLEALERIDRQDIPVDLRLRYPLGENWSVLEPVR